MKTPLPEVFDMLEQLLMAQGCHLSSVANIQHPEAEEKLTQGNLNKQRGREVHL